MDQEFWPDDIPFGSRTVVYGHNGSGKSTLSELLLSLAEEDCATEIVWQDETKNTTSISTGSSMPSLSLAVFTRSWVKANLSAFLDGESASAIVVTLGKEAIDAKEEESSLAEELKQLKDKVEKATAERERAESLQKALVQEVQGRIVSQLKEFDFKYYTKNRFSVKKVRELLQNYAGDFPDEASYTEALQQLNTSAPSLLPEITSPPSSVATQLTSLSTLLAETPARVALQELATNPVGQNWVEAGLPLHETIDQCLFCGNKIQSTRRAKLAHHFDESWKSIQSKAQSLLNEIRNEIDQLKCWQTGLPTASKISNELQPDYQCALQTVLEGIEKSIEALEAVEVALQAKKEDPDTTPSEPDWSALESAPSILELAQVITKHNDQVKEYAEITDRRKNIVQNYLIGSQSAAFCQYEEEVQTRESERVNATTESERVERRLNEVRQDQFTTKKMADTLTRDLERVYGKNHLTVTVTADGKSYSCRRGNKPGTHLSEGERTTLALLYFLRKLEDKQTPIGDPKKCTVVIDDPSSSLDREAIFATHQWLVDCLKDFGQYIIFTHDFNLLRLFLKSQNNAWGKSLNRINKDNDAEEARFPKVTFLEMFATDVNGERRSRIDKLPQSLRNNTSEYSYLFSMVMNGITHPEEQDHLFLLPNAARRILEVFASYKVPQYSKFLKQLETLIESQEGEPFRDVYDFCNRYSHGEGSESIDVLDARTTTMQLRRCMKFLRSVDTEHFTNMCTATNTDAKAI